MFQQLLDLYATREDSLETATVNPLDSRRRSFRHDSATRRE